MFEKIKTLSGFKIRPAQPEPTEETQRQMLLAMQSRQMFAGASGSRAARRARGKMAKKSRKLNRGR